MGDPTTAALVFADWLDEHDHADLAEAIRIVFDNKVGNADERYKLVRLFNQEVARLKSLRYQIASNGTVVIEDSTEPKIAELFDGESNSLNLNFDGHAVYGYKWTKDSKPIKINPDLITREETVEALILGYMTTLVSNLVKSNVRGNNGYSSDSYSNKKFDTNQRIQSSTVYHSIVRLNHLIDSEGEDNSAAIEKEIKTLENAPEVQDSDHDIAAIAESVFQKYTGDTPLRKRLINVIVKHSGDQQLSDLIHHAAYNDMDNMCPVIASIGKKLGYEEIEFIFNQNPVNNALFVVDIWEVEHNWVGEEGHQELETEEPVHEVEDEICDLETTLRYLEDFDYESGSSWASSRQENYRTGAETERTMHIGLSENVEGASEYQRHDIGEDTLEILYKASKRR